jgi:hypothetical protein
VKVRLLQYPSQGLCYHRARDDRNILSDDGLYRGPTSGNHFPPFRTGLRYPFELCYEGDANHDTLRV